MWVLVSIDWGPKIAAIPCSKKPHAGEKSLRRGSEIGIDFQSFRLPFFDAWKLSLFSTFSTWAKSRDLESNLLSLFIRSTALLKAISMGSSPISNKPPEKLSRGSTEFKFRTINLHSASITFRISNLSYSISIYFMRIFTNICLTFNECQNLSERILNHEIDLPVGTFHECEVGLNSRGLGVTEFRLNWNILGTV